MAEDHSPYYTGHSRFASSLVIGLSGFLCRAFLYTLNRTETHGLDRFLRLLDERKNVEGRTKGLITVGNHTSVMDDPIMWGVLPFRYQWNPDNVRWTLGSYDITFQNRAMSTFFSIGQALPTHRNQHSPFGGLFQPTITQAIRLLSDGPFNNPTPFPLNTNSPPPTTDASSVASTLDIPDPFTHPTSLPQPPTTTYTTNFVDAFPASSAYATRRHAWIHIFPEGRIHQHPRREMRYFKWGVARLILEADVCPDVVPVWIEGLEQVMSESRGWPRWVPRAGKEVSVAFGEVADAETVFGEVRRRWNGLVREDARRRLEERERGVGEGEMEKGGEGLDVGVLSEGLKYGREAVELRKETTMIVRKLVLDLRKQRGLPDEDPKAGLVETYREEGGSQGTTSSQPQKMKDGSWVRDD
ncbi:acyltransferase-domain-containing protein [Viridothelium virens]|uniref:Tafazzin family protein n=1 Tax=Viridothelium virens TaxID=1048519 RepID=A0A6A6H688_VIRVR|nr:acyltransferase-domain-containing protein [Viridothelium virens]